jgi:ribosomal protein S18 acetylase RimI-like enzyme
MLMAAVLLPVTIRRPAALFRVLRASLRPVFSEAAADEAVLFSIAVDPSLQNRGLGGQMVRAFLEEARRRGAKRVALTTDTQDNDAVNRFYLRLGFRLGSKFLTPEKRQMNEYVIDLAAAPEVTDHRLVAHQ